MCPVIDFPSLPSCLGWDRHLAGPGDDRQSRVPWGTVLPILSLDGTAKGSSFRAHVTYSLLAPQQRLYFLPDPHGQGELSPGIVRPVDAAAETVGLGELK